MPKFKIEVSENNVPLKISGSAEREMANREEELLKMNETKTTKQKTAEVDE